MSAVLFDEQERIDSILNNTPAIFPISSNPLVDPKWGEWRSIPSLAIPVINQYSDIIERESLAQGIDPDWVNAIIYLENAQDIQDYLTPDDWESGKPPMNLHPSVWAEIMPPGSDFSDPETNIKAGITLIARIKERLLPEDQTLDKIASIYNFTGQETVVNYGARVLNIYEHRLWTDPKDYIYQTISDLVSGLSDAISSAYWDFLDAVAASFIVDPLIIDMAGDGLSLDSWQTSNALFDLDANGTKENTGWTKANDDDAFLVIDKNNNGNVDNIMEMFGNAATAGFVDLKSYDSNNDNLINASDSQFGLMKLWKDTNANGTVDNGELTTLATNGITQISLNKYNDWEMIEGNIQTAVSEVTFSNGTTRNIHEVSFGFQGSTITANPDASLPSNFRLNIESILLPYSRGYGTMYSWQAAMTLDSTLLAMAKDMAATQPKDFYLLNDKFQSFLFRWAGVENATAATVYGGANVSLDPRKMAFMEKITGLDFVNVTSASINLAAQAWDLFFNEFLTKFLVQGPLAAAFPNASYDFATDTLSMGDTLDKVTTNIESLASSMDLNSFANYAYYAKSIVANDNTPQLAIKLRLAS